MGRNSQDFSPATARTKTLGVLLFLVFFLFPLTAQAIDRFDIVTTEQLKDMLAAREGGGEDFLLVNTLDDIIYRNEHIPGSVSLPWAKVAEYEKVIGPDKGKSLIFY